MCWILYAERFLRIRLWKVYLIYLNICSVTYADSGALKTKSQNFLENPSLDISKTLNDLFYKFCM